ncbi:MAG TPA: hypothetical protein VGL42_10470 [Opitutaceae bacterium]|jgi:hypothetical protein
MNFDLRLPLGLIFTLFGAMLVIYGLIPHAEPGPTADLNINLSWGIVVLLFGLWMLMLAVRARKRR